MFRNRKRMKNLVKIGLLFLVVCISVSCEKHVVEYAATPINDETDAQFQLHYMVPIATGTANNINKVELNDQLLTNETAPWLYTILYQAELSENFLLHSPVM